MKGRAASRAALLAASAILLGAFAVAPLAAVAEYDPLASGATRLSLDRGFLSMLKRDGVRLGAIAPAKLEGGVVTFPVSGGKFDPTDGKGTIEHDGALVFESGNRKIPLKALQLKTTARRTPFSAKAGGGQLKIGTAAKIAVARDGFGGRVAVHSLTLSAKLATRLGKKLRLRGVFREGESLGSTLTRVQPATTSVIGKGRAELVLDPGIAAKLNGLFVAVNPIFPAEHLGSAFTLPIFGGTIATDAAAGTIETSGALEFLQLGGGQVFWREGRLELADGSFTSETDTEPSPPYAGKVGRIPIAGFVSL